MTMPLVFNVDHADTYIMKIVISYTSKYFTEQYNLQLVTLRDVKLNNASLRSNEYEITDTIRKIVYKK